MSVNGDPVSYQQWKYYIHGGPHVTLYQVELKYFDRKFERNPRYCLDNCESPNQLNLSHDLNLTKAAYPHMKGGYCALMLLHNLAHPDWISVNCSHALLGDTLCVVEPKAKLDPTGEIITSPDNKMCPMFTLVRDGQCFLFTWFRSNRSTEDQCSSRTNFENFDIKIFERLFSSVSVSFPPTHSPDLSQRISYKRFLHFIQYFKTLVANKSTEGLFICSSSRMRTSSDKGGLFHCGNNTHIVGVFECDGEIDCPGLEATDEQHCNCSLETMNIREIGMTNWSVVKSEEKFNFRLNVSCSRLVSQIFDTIDQQHFFKDPAKNETFLCSHERTIKLLMVNDLVVDCGPDADDEHDLVAMLKYGKKYFCTRPEQLPCKHGHSFCYNISDICSFRLNEFDHLAPCRTGNHLENCTEFECNLMFKCPKYYCVPWAYVCDRKWDCPLGTDESEVHNCATGRQCENMFKCKFQQTCIHLESICDASLDCLLGDDEALCQFSGVTCPSECECFVYILKCKDLRMSLKFSDMNTFPYFVVFVQRCDTEEISKMLGKMYQVKMLFITSSNISDICKVASQTKEATQIDYSDNLIRNLDTKCFQHMPHTKGIDLSANQIHKAHHHSFFKVWKLQLVNLARNNLVELEGDILFGSDKLTVLSIRGNLLCGVEKQNFRLISVELLDTNNYQICCIVPQNVKCLATMPWFKSCFSPFAADFRKIIFSIVILILFVTNALSIVIQFKSAKPRLTTFCTITLAINICNLTCGISNLILLLSGNQSSSNFAMREEQSRKSPLCCLVCALDMNFHFLSALLLLFLTLCRLMVVIHPLNSKFKRRKFIWKCLCATIGHNVALTVCATTWIKVTLHSLPSVLCSPFLDPTKLVLVMKVVLLMSSTVQSVSSLSMLAMYTQLVLSLQKARNMALDATSTKIKTNVLTSTLVQVVFFIVTVNVCWVPSNIVYLWALHVEKYSTDIVVWTVMVVVPINSVFVPLALNFSKLSKFRKKGTSRS